MPYILKGVLVLVIVNLNNTNSYTVHVYTTLIHILYMYIQH